MNAFLRRTKLRVSSAAAEPLLLVLGNESCDLDSAVSALSVAFYYAHQSTSTEASSSAAAAAAHRRQYQPEAIVPVLNVARRLLATKTEVTFYLRQKHIELDNLVCRDELSEAQIDGAEFVLVDHHVSPHATKTLQVIDHRPVDTDGADALPTECDRRIETVGSCCTLIGDMILAEYDERQRQPSPGLEQSLKDLLEFVYPVIVLDTVNFSPAANRTTALDRSVCQRIEQLHAIRQPLRQRIFDELVEARSDVTGLDAMQLLHKDMKVARSRSISETMNGGVVLPGLPIRLREFVRMPNAAESVRDVAKEFDCAVVVLMSLVVDGDGNVRRELAVIPVSDSARLDADILEGLRSPSAKLDLVEWEERPANFENGMFFEQLNAQASRKQVLPIVQRVLNE